MACVPNMSIEIVKKSLTSVLCCLGILEVLGSIQNFDRRNASSGKMQGSSSLALFGITPGGTAALQGKMLPSFREKD